MPLSLSFSLLVELLVTPLSGGLSLQIEDREDCGLFTGQDTEILQASAAPLQVQDGKNDQPGPHLEAMKMNVPSNGGWWHVPPFDHLATPGNQRAEEYPLNPGAPGMIYAGFPGGDPYRGVNGFATGRWFGTRRQEHFTVPSESPVVNIVVRRGEEFKTISPWLPPFPPPVRRPRQSDTASFFYSLDENADGLLAEDEIREFVQEVGGSTLDDHSEISGGVSTVMGRLDTDSQEGIGLKELSSWINRFESILTVEETADWVRYAVQLPEDVAEAFRSNSISGYDFVDLLNYDGHGLLLDLGLKRSYQKRIIKAIEIRLLGLGDEPPAPKLHPPSYLGAGKARIAWSAAELVENDAAPSSEYASPENDSDENVDGEGATGGDDLLALVPSEASCRKDEGPAASDGGKALVDARAAIASAAGPSTSTCSSSGTENECTERTSDSVSGREGGRGKEGKSSLVDSSQTFPVHKYVLQRSCLGCHAASVSSPATSHPAVATAAVASDVHKGLGDSTADSGWVTVHEANVDSTSTNMVFVDSGLVPGKVYAYRLRAWNRVGHSEASFVHVSTPPAPSLWTKPWRLISPWLPSGNNSAASGHQPTQETENESDKRFNISDELPGIGDMDWTFAVEGMRAAWLILSWAWWGVRYSLSAVNAILVLAGISANLMRLRAAYGDGGTGAPARRNWAALLLWKVNHVLTRNRLVRSVAEGVNARLERLLGAPAAPARGIYRQESFRVINPESSASSSQQSAGSVSSGWSSETRRDWSPGSAVGVDRRQDRAVLSRIEEEYVGMGVDGGLWGPREASRGSVPPWADAPANDSTPTSRLRSVPPSFASGTERFPPGEPSCLHNRRRRQPPSRTVLAETPQRRSGDSDELYSPPEFSRAGRRAQAGTGTGTGAHSGIGGVSMLPAPTAGEERSGGRVTVVSHRWGLFRRDGTVNSRAGIFTKESDDDVVRQLLERESWGRAVGISSSEGFKNDGREKRLVRGGRGHGVAGEVPAPPSLRRSATSDSRLTMHLRKSSLSRLALGLKKGEATGRDGWLKEIQEAQSCFSCHGRFKPVTRPRHHCSRCNRVFCGRHGFTSHPPVTPCSIPGECICDACIGSVSGDIRGTAIEAGEDLTTRNCEVGPQTIAPTTRSEGDSTSNGRRLSFGHLCRFRLPSSRTKFDQASTFSAASQEAASAVAAAASVPRDSSAETASPSEVSPATPSRDVPRGVSMNESRVGDRVSGGRGWTLGALGVARRSTA